MNVMRRLRIGETAPPNRPDDDVAGHVLGWYDPDSAAFDGDAKPDSIEEAAAPMTSGRGAASWYDDRD